MSDILDKLALKNKENLSSRGFKPNSIPGSKFDNQKIDDDATNADAIVAEDEYYFGVGKKRQEGGYISRIED